MSINSLPDSVKNTAISGDGRAASRPLTAADRLPTVLLPPGPRPPDPIPNPKRHRMEHRRMTRVQADTVLRSEEHTSELQSLMRTSYAVFCLKKKTNTTHQLYPDKQHQNNT